MLYTHKNHDKRSGNVFGRSLYMSTIAHPYDADGNIILRPSPYYEAHANRYWMIRKGLTIIIL